MLYQRGLALRQDRPIHAVGVFDGILELSSQSCDATFMLLDRSCEVSLGFLHVGNQFFLSWCEPRGLNIPVSDAREAASILIMPGSYSSLDPRDDVAHVGRQHPPLTFRAEVSSRQNYAACRHEQRREISLNFENFIARRPPRPFWLWQDNGPAGRRRARTARRRPCPRGRRRHHPRFTAPAKRWDGLPGL